MSKNKQTVAATHHTNYLIVHPPSQQSDPDPPTLGDGAACEDRKELVQYSSRVSPSRATCTSAPATGGGPCRTVVWTAGGGDELDTGLILFIFFMEMTVGPIHETLLLL